MLSNIVCHIFVSILLFNFYICNQVIMSFVNACNLFGVPLERMNKSFKYQGHKLGDMSIEWMKTTMNIASSSRKKKIF